MTPPRGSIDVLLSNFAFKVGLRVFGGNTVATSNLNEIAELGKEPVRRAQLDDETREYINLDCGCFSPKPRPWKRPSRSRRISHPGAIPSRFPRVSTAHP
jgi:hypothetical protein